MNSSLPAKTRSKRKASEIDETSNPRAPPLANENGKRIRSTKKLKKEEKSGPVELESPKTPTKVPASNPQSIMKPTSSQSQQVQNNNFSDPSLVDEDEEEEEEFVEKPENEAEAPDESLAIAPRQMHTFCKQILELDEGGTIHLDRRKAGSQLETLLKNKEFAAGINLKEMQSSLRAYFRSAVHLSNITLKNMIHLVMDYAADEKSVAQHPQFPKAPVSALTRFYRHMGYNNPMINKVPQNIKQQFVNKSDKIVQQIETEYKEARREYIKQLQHFVSTNQDSLFQNQIRFVHKKINQLERLDQEPVPPKKKEKEKEKDPPAKAKTAFDFFKLSKKDKYLELDEERREKKLRKRFDKLEDGQRQIFEDIAKNSQ